MFLKLLSFFLGFVIMMVLGKPVFLHKLWVVRREDAVPYPTMLFPRLQHASSL